LSPVGGGTDPPPTNSPNPVIIDLSNPPLDAGVVARVAEVILPAPPENDEEEEEVEEEVVIKRPPAPVTNNSRISFIVVP